MEKAFDLELLKNELKAQGLEIGEESAKIAVKAVFNWIEMSVKLSENKFDDFFLLARPQIEAVILPAIEQINPKD